MYGNVCICSVNEHVCVEARQRPSLGVVPQRWTIYLFLFFSLFPFFMCVYGVHVCVSTWVHTEAQGDVRIHSIAPLPNSLGQSLPIKPESCSGNPAPVLTGWNSRQAAKPTQHLSGFLGLTLHVKLSLHPNPPCFSETGSFNGS